MAFTYSQQNGNSDDVMVKSATLSVHPELGESRGLAISEQERDAACYKAANDG